MKFKTTFLVATALTLGVSFAFATSSAGAVAIPPAPISRSMA